MAGKKRGSRGMHRLLLGGVLGLLLCIALLAVGAKLVQQGKLPEEAARTAAMVACAVASLVGALIALHRQSRRWLGAACLAGVYAFVFLLTAAFCSLGQGSLRISVQGLACMLLPLLLTALLGGSRKRHRRR